MPMYEFYCPTCNVIRTFFSRRPSLRIPECPSCGTKLVREVSVFRTGTSDGTDELGDAAMDEAAITRALELFGPKLDKLVSNGDPKASAKRIREFAESCATVELAAQALHCEPRRIAKTLSFHLDDRVILISGQWSVVSE